MLLLCTNFPVDSGDGIARMYRILSWAFGWIASLLYTMAAPFYIPTSNTWGLQFLHILTSDCCCLSFWLYPSCWMSGGIHSFDLHFPKRVGHDWATELNWTEEIMNNVEFFSFFLGLLAVYLWRNVFSSPLLT